MDDVLERMEHISFQGRSLATARRIWEKMLQGDCTIFFGLAGALSAGGMRLVVAHLIAERYIDCLVSTGANLYHDLHETRGRRHYIGSASGDDAALQADRIDRVYDTYASEDEFVENDEWIAAFVLTLERRPYSSRELLYRLGEYLWKQTGRDGILTAAYRAAVPIFCPAIADSSIGMGLSQARHRDPQAGHVDVIGDIIESANLVIRRPRTASVVLRRRHAEELHQPGHRAGRVLRRPRRRASLRAADRDRRAPLWRRLGLEPGRGAQLGQAGADAEQVTVHADATIALPLLASALATSAVQIARGTQAACASIWRVGPWRSTAGRFHRTVSRHANELSFRVRPRRAAGVRRRAAGDPLVRRLAGRHPSGPVDRTTSYVPGTRNGPREILQASSHMELWDEEIGADVHGVGIFTLPEMELPFGELAPLMDEIRRVASEILARDKFLVTLGGEHSITPPLVAAAAATYHRAVGPADRRARRSARLLHGHAAQPRLRDAPEPRVRAVTQVGIRSLSTEEAEAAPGAEHDDLLRRHDAHAIRAGSIASSTRLTGPVYLTIDVDGLDPAIMPATGTPEPGGLSWYEILALLRATIARQNGRRLRRRRAQPASRA